jgi:hypothetical protein
VDGLTAGMGNLSAATGFANPIKEPIKINPAINPMIARRNTLMECRKLLIAFSYFDINKPGATS